jgi:hypothetical protein
MLETCVVSKAPRALRTRQVIVRPAPADTRAQILMVTIERHRDHYHQLLQYFHYNLSVLKKSSAITAVPIAAAAWRPLQRQPEPLASSAPFSPFARRSPGHSDATPATTRARPARRGPARAPIRFRGLLLAGQAVGVTPDAAGAPGASGPESFPACGVRCEGRSCIDHTFCPII